MNRENIQKAITILRRAKQFDMRSWAIPSAVKVKHPCGSPGCFAGHIAQSAEFQADGGTVFETGAPIINQLHGAEAIAHWLGIDREIAHRLVHGMNSLPGDDPFYNKPYEDVTVDDVIVKLESILNNTLTLDEN